MSKNTDVIPFTELVERVREIARIASENDFPRARGAVNDVYARRIPTEEDWTFLLVSSAITCQHPINDGTVTVTTGGTTVTLASTSLGTANNAWRIKFAENSDVYTFTYIDSTAGTISPPLSEGQNISAGAYIAFQPVYALAPDFDRFPKNGGLLFYQGGRITQIPEQRETPYYANYNPNPTATPATCRLVQYGTDGVPYIEVQPPPNQAYNLPYEYLKRPVVLRETTAGVATVDAGSTSVTFQAGARLGEMTTGMYFRIDAFGTKADSEWYRIIDLNQATSTATLQMAFAPSAATSAGYVVCSAPDYPVKVQPAIMWGAICNVTADQNDPLFQFYDQKYQESINESKKVFKTRIYKQEVESILSDWQYRR